MRIIDLKVSELKNLLQSLGLPTTGIKNELVARLMDVYPDGFVPDLTTMEMQDGTVDEVGQDRRTPLPDEMEMLRREMELMRRERDLAKKEIELMQRERELLRNSPGTDSTVSSRPNVSIKAVGDLVSHFDGSNDAYYIWKQQIQLLRSTYELDDNTTKILIGTKVKDKALRWLHSRPEHIRMDADSLLTEMGRMFDHRPNKLLLRKKFEERKWKSGESFGDYHHDKIIMANNASIPEDEIIDYVIDGIPDVQLQNQARMQRFDSLASLFRAFENISLRFDGRRPTNVRMQPGQRTDAGDGDVSRLTRRCFNCQGEGHLMASCPRPRRAAGSCFSCGSVDHVVRDCPSKAGSSTASGSTATALIEVLPTLSCEEEASRHEGQAEHQLREPLTVPTRECCVLMTESQNENYFVEALVNSGSIVNVMIESIYLTYFSEYRLCKDKREINYGGVNKFPLMVLGHIAPNIKFKLLDSHVFTVKFIVVPDSTMSYDVLLGREFLTQTGITVILNETIDMKFDKAVNEILHIDVIERKDILNDVRDRLDHTPRYESREELINLSSFSQSDHKACHIDEIAPIESNKPFYTPRRLSWHERGEVKEIADNLLNREIIRPSNLNFRNQIVFVKKKNDKYRINIDYRTLFNRKRKKPQEYKVGDYIKNVITTPGINKGPYVINKILDNDRYI